MRQALVRAKAPVACTSGYRIHVLLPTGDHVAISARARARVRARARALPSAFWRAQVGTQQGSRH
jgi:hypothetical protein